MTEVYLDNAATTAVHPEAAEIAVRAMTKEYGNPSSLHRKGLESERIVKAARRTIALSLNVEPAEIVFTSGGTEANNLAIKGAAWAKRGRGRRLVTTAIEHSSVLRAFDDLEEDGYEVIRLPVDRRGIVDPERVARSVTKETTLVSVMLVNNEIGTVEPIQEIARAAREKNGDVLIHCDAVQAFGKIPVFPRQLGVDLLSLSGHKIHGPKGIGALYVRRGVRLRPLFGGGDQEGGLRSGTENVPGIAAFAKAAEIASAGRAEAERRLRELRRLLIERIREIQGADVNGPADDETAAPHIINVAFSGVRGEVLVHALEDRGVYVSTGSACSSRKAEKSHVLEALGLGKNRLEGSIRISLSVETTREEIERAAGAIRDALGELRG